MPDLDPLSRRASGQERALHSGVPPHLQHPLTEWIGHHETHEKLRVAALQAEIGYSPPTEAKYAVHRMAALDKGIRASHNPEEAFLDVVEQILYLTVHAPDGESHPYTLDRLQTESREAKESLEEILRLGGSKWRVASDRLEARVDDAVTHAFEHAVEGATGTSARQHLEAAWRAAYGRNPNPSNAYSEAIKAVESAAAPVVSPRNLKATLGTMMGDLRSTASLWRFAVEPRDIAPVIVAMTTIWEGQTDRHGGAQPTRAVSQDSAEAIVLLAATVVHWFRSGSVERR